MYVLLGVEMVIPRVVATNAGRLELIKLETTMC